MSGRRGIGDVEAIFNDDATTLGQVIVDTSVDSANLADNDLYEIIARGPDSTSNATDYAVIQLKITDITAASENGQIILQTTANGSDVTGMTIGHNAGGTHACTIVGATTLSSTLDVNGAMTCTNLTMDTGSTLTVGGVAGFTGIVTNKSTTVTNIAYFYNGVITNYTTSP